MRVLDLSLKYEWYDLIERGKKVEEYRDLRSYYANRLLYRKPLGVKEYWDGALAKMRNTPTYDPANLVKDYGIREYDAVRFHRGQGGRQTMLLEYKGLAVGKGNPAWGAPDVDVFIIKLGRRIG